MNTQSKVAYYVIMLALFLIGFYGIRLAGDLNIKLVTSAAGIISGVITFLNQRFWEGLKKSSDAISSRHISDRESLDLKRTLALQTRFIHKRLRWNYTIFILLITASVVCAGLKDTESIPAWAAGVIMGLFATMLPAIVTLMEARYDHHVMDVELASRARSAESTRRELDRLG